MNTPTLRITAALALTLGAISHSHAGGVSGGNANAEWQIYGWQNWSYEFVNVGNENADDSDRHIQRISNNAANIGFSASIDTGMSLGGESVKANFRCEQFTFHNRFGGSGFFGYNDFCNRNSKISLSGAFGEFMLGQWLLPHNEAVAQWVDPFYDAGADSHSSIMGSVGYGTRFFNGGFGFDNGGGFGGSTNFGDDDDAPATPYNGGFGSANNGFNRRQNGLIQYWSPNLNGFTFRLATTNAHSDPGYEYFGGGGDVTVTTPGGNTELDPRIWSTSLAYENTLTSGDSVWLAATYEKHDEWAAADFGCEDSDDTSWRVAGRYIHQWGNGQSTRLSAMYENMDYDHEDCSGGDGALGIIGGGFGSTELERDAWMLSGIQNFGNGWDMRFSYMDADEFDCSGTTNCNGIGEDDTDASAFNLGVYYTMPAGTELRVTYSEVDNEDSANYDFGISPAGVNQGEDLEMWALGIVQWF